MREVFHTLGMPLSNGLQEDFKFDLYSEDEEEQREIDRFQGTEREAERYNVH